MQSFDLKNFEEKYKKIWRSQFESDPGTSDKFYLNVAYPYPSGAMHIGHGRTYIVPDVIGRFWRMKGRQVLYPMAFHVTGTPVIGISRRIATRDEKTIRLYTDLYRVPPETLDSFVDPMAIVDYFSREYERVMSRCGLSIDWRRRFTTVDPTYSKFIEWQYLHLHDQNRVVRGAHPVKYCMGCDNPVGDHDLLEGEHAEIVKYVLVMFTWNEYIIPCATLRPETTYGVTNLWVNPDVVYQKVRVDGQRWILSPEATEKIRLQDHEVVVDGDISGADLVDQTASNPLSGAVQILPAGFVDSDMATGIVMSVPAHAPFDYIALRDLQQQGKYLNITPVPLITVAGYGRCPAQDAVDRAGISNQNDPAMEVLTQEVYNAEHSKGRMLPEYGGKPVKEARNEISELMLERYGSAVMFEFDNRNVVCRCGTRVYVRILHDQWFLKYSDPEWKEAVHGDLDTMTLVPPEMRAEFNRTIDWLNDWACTRRVGLGTKVPWDKDWLVEPLSDSTIYMAYYTIAHKIRNIEPELLTPDVFDYIFLGKGDPQSVPRTTLDDLRQEFLYWYPYDFRFSAKDLISNHLTFQLFHHDALFPSELRPKGMVIFGMGLLEGAKMSSSKGNVILLEDALDEFGADTVRMFLVGSAEPWQDFDWRNELVSSVRKQIERFWATINEGIQSEDTYDIDAWVLSRMQKHIGMTTSALESFQTRQALQEAYFSIESDLKWYRRRLPEGVRSSAVINTIAPVWVRLLSPFIPYTCEALWAMVGTGEPVGFSSWPQTDSSLVNTGLELSEELLSRTVEDIESIMRLIQIDTKSITLYVAPEWKWEIFCIIASASDRKKVMGDIMKNDDMRNRGKEATDAAKQITNQIHRFPPELVSSIAANQPDELTVFNGVRDFLQREFNVTVSVVNAEESSHPKARAALPFKPAIVVE